MEGVGREEEFKVQGSGFSSCWLPPEGLGVCGLGIMGFGVHGGFRDGGRVEGLGFRV